MSVHFWSVVSLSSLALSFACAAQAAPVAAPDVDGSALRMEGGYSVLPIAYSEKAGRGLFQLIDFQQRRFNAALCGLEREESQDAAGAPSARLKLVNCEPVSQTWMRMEEGASLLFRDGWRERFVQAYDVEIAPTQAAVARNAASAQRSPASALLAFALSALNAPGSSRQDPAAGANSLYGANLDVAGEQAGLAMAIVEQAARLSAMDLIAMQAAQEAARTAAQRADAAELAPLG